jgi:hypothetical protein
MKGDLVCELLGFLHEECVEFDELCVHLSDGETDHFRALTINLNICYI